MISWRMAAFLFGLSAGPALGCHDTYLLFSFSWNGLRRLLVLHLFAWLVEDISDDLDTT